MLLRRFHHQQGIALGPILFIIAILAIIAAAISAGVGGFNASTRTESAKVTAATIITQMQNVRDGINALLANGCADTQINFLLPASTGYGDYYNPNAPTDHSCDVFDPRGANLTYPLFDSLLSGETLSNLGGKLFLGQLQIVGFGNTDLGNQNDPAALDLILVVQLYTSTIYSGTVNPFGLAICQKVNQMAGISSMLPTTGIEPGIFFGTFGNAFQILGGWGLGTEFTGQAFGCFANDNPGSYRIYMVVEAR